MDIDKQILEFNHNIYFGIQKYLIIINKTTN